MKLGLQSISLMRKARKLKCVRKITVLLQLTQHVHARLSDFDNESEEKKETRDIKSEISFTKLIRNVNKMNTIMTIIL